MESVRTERVRDSVPFTQLELQPDHSLHSLLCGVEMGGGVREREPLTSRTWAERLNPKP